MVETDPVESGKQLQAASTLLRAVIAQTHLKPKMHTSVGSLRQFWGLVTLGIWLTSTYRGQSPLVALFVSGHCTPEDQLRHAMLQGMAPWLVGRVRRLHISTHSRRIHSDILRWLQLAGWTILAQFTFLLFGRNINYES